MEKARRPRGLEVDWLAPLIYARVSGPSSSSGLPQDPLEIPQTSLGKGLMRWSAYENSLCLQIRYELCRQGLTGKHIGSLMAMRPHSVICSAPVLRATRFLWAIVLPWQGAVFRGNQRGGLIGGVGKRPLPKLAKISPCRVLYINRFHLIFMFIIVYIVHFCFYLNSSFSFVVGVSMLLCFWIFANVMFHSPLSSITCIVLFHFEKCNKQASFETIQEIVWIGEPIWPKDPGLGKLGGILVHSC